MAIKMRIFGGPKNVKGLIGALEDKDWHIWGRAAGSLGEIKELREIVKIK